VPVPDAGIPRETVEAARAIVEENVEFSSNGDRFWELSGGILRCAECGGRMRTTVTRKKDGKRYFYYTCANRRDQRSKECTNGKTLRAQRTEDAIWDLVMGLLSDPERVRADLEAMIEQEREGSRGNPDREVKAWLERLAEADRMRAGYQELAANGLMTLEELGVRLKVLENARTTATRELEAIRERSERLESLERDRDTLLKSYVGAVPETLKQLSPEEHRQIYGMLRL
jgi:site-specific DNA recombinase